MQSSARDLRAEAKRLRVEPVPKRISSLDDPKDNMGFREFTCEPNIYRKTFTLNCKDVEILLSSYVDDRIICSSSEEARLWLMKNLENRLPINQKSSGVITMDVPEFALSMHMRCDRDRRKMRFDQLRAIEALTAKFRVMDSKPKSMPIKQNRLASFI